MIPLDSDPNVMTRTRDAKEARHFRAVLLNVVLLGDYALSYAGADAPSPTSPNRRSRR